jgi:hypothetical protein
MLVWGGLFWGEPRTIAALTILVIGVLPAGDCTRTGRTLKNSKEYVMI